MPKVKSGQKIKRKKFAFSIESADAKEVILMGDFNNWNPKTHPMKSNGNGMWNKSVVVPPGRYEYKFLVDRQWIEDPKNDKTCPNCFGTNNSVFNVTVS